MLQIIEPYFTHKDSRGILQGLINFGKWEEINLISSQPNTERGNHYHKDTLELFIILQGRINVILEDIKYGKLTEKRIEKIVTEGDVFLVDPFVNHTFIVLENAKWINALSKKIDPNNPDIHKLSIPPLIK